MSGYYLPGLNGFRAIAAAIVLIAHTLQYVGVLFLHTATCLLPVSVTGFLNQKVISLAFRNLFPEIEK